MKGRVPGECQAGPCLEGLRMSDYLIKQVIGEKQQLGSGGKTWKPCDVHWKGNTVITTMQ